MERLPMSEMVEGDIYRLRSRNLVVGVWRVQSCGFIGIREKFGDLYLFEEFHHEADRHLGTASPIARIGRVPEGIALEEGRSQPDPEREGRSFFVMNQALFDVLKPYDEAINAELVKEWEQAQIEAESKRWAPQTREEYERERRVAEVREWWRSIPPQERLDGRKPFWDEYQRRLDAAIKGE